MDILVQVRVSVPSHLPHTHVNTTFRYIIVTPNQMTAGALVISYWIDRDRVNPGVWITIFYVTIIFINYFGVRLFGEFEFWLSSFKVITIVGIMIMSLVFALGGGPSHE